MAKKNKILLLFPKVGVNPISPQPPVSLLVIAPYLEAAGYEPIIIDQRIDNNYKKTIRQFIEETIFVGVTSMTGEQLRYAIELVQFVKFLKPDMPVVFGGIHASLLPEQTVLHPGIDMVVVGEGEDVVVDIARHYERKLPLDSIQGIYYKTNGTIRTTPLRDPINLETLRAPAWHLISKNHYSNFGIQCGRGCPHQCAFCYNRTFNRQQWRFRNPAQILEEIRFLYHTHDIRELIFLDDNFFTNFDRVAELCGLIIKHDILIQWSTTCRADYFARFTPSFVSMLKQSGMKLLFVGGESGSPEILKRIRKGITTEDILTMARVTRQYDIHVIVSFMLGFPFETPRDHALTFSIMDTIQRMSSAVCVNGVNIYTPYPGTELFDESQRNGFKPPRTLAGWSTYVYNMSNLPWLTHAKNSMLENISFISRFYFWHDHIKRSFLKYYYYPFYWFFRLSAVIRWKTRLFNQAVEWSLFRYIRKTFLE
jgi:radical SAM superfamily enzyme YgiQ (UPF0313 family)